MAADLFVAGKVDAFDFAAGVCSVGTQVESESTGSFNLPSAATAGCGYVYDADSFSVCTRAKADYYFSGYLAAGIGAELLYDGMFAVRAGYHYGGESIIPNFASAGLGLHVGEFALGAAYKTLTWSAGDGGGKESLAKGISQNLRLRPQCLVDLPRLRGEVDFPVRLDCR